MSLNLFIIGPSGCGKSTQAKLIAEKYHLSHLSMGQLLRDKIGSDSPLGKKLKFYVDQGIWVPDDLIFEILLLELNKLHNENFIVDGFPRVLNQGKFIEHYLTELQKPLSLIIHLDVTFEEIMTRRARLGQKFQDAARTDNTPEAVAKRQASYNDTINPIKEYFSSSGKLFDVDGNRPVDPIFQDICQKINEMR
ncbi:nucleoside monophosphate kinase [Patescibacteria group bacterium]|nr:nucleoside monophosphate kinase [Patescibacteria group bacterium]